MEPKNHVEEASRALTAAIASATDEAVRYGLEKALLIIEKAVPDLHKSLAETSQILEFDSAAVDLEDGEEYVYQGHLDRSKEALARFDSMNYSDEEPKPGL